MSDVPPGAVPESKWPAWLRSKVDQRLAKIKESGAHKIQFATVLMSTLTDPGTMSFEDWNYACDACGKIVKSGLTPGQLSQELGGKTVIMTFGVCDEHKF